MRISGFKTAQKFGVAFLALGLTFGCSDDQQQEEDQLETTEEGGEFGGDFSAADATLDAAAGTEGDASLGALPDGVEGNSGGGIGGVGEAAQQESQAQSGSGNYQQGDIFEYTVVRGDSLSLIAMRVYGTFQRWPEIQAVTNRPNPNLIYPGNIIRIPLSDAGAVQWAQGNRHLSTGHNISNSTVNNQGGTVQTVTVQRGDTLSSISQRYFGTTAQWRTIWNQNRSAVPNPNAIPVGTQLQITAPAH